MWILYIWRLSISLLLLPAKANNPARLFVSNLLNYLQGWVAFAAHTVWWVHQAWTRVAEYVVYVGEDWNRIQAATEAEEARAETATVTNFVDPQLRTHPPPATPGTL